MGVYYTVVNETKREWFDALALGESVKSWPLRGLTANAVARLVCKSGIGIGLDGAWSGDAVSFVDDGQDLNLDMTDYEDVSYKAIAILADDERVAEFVVRSMWTIPECMVPMLLKAIELVHPQHRENLRKPAESFFGPGWEGRSKEEWRAWRMAASAPPRE